MPQITRVVHRRADPGCERNYEELAKGMLDASSKCSGYLFSTLIPPRVDGEEFHIVQSFNSQADLDVWRQSQEAEAWHRRLADVAAEEPEYRHFDETKIWFSATGLTARAEPARWRMAVFIWLGIFPLASFFIWFVAPHLGVIPYIPRMMILTALIVATMVFGVLPQLLRRLGWFLKP